MPRTIACIMTLVILVAATVQPTFAQPTSAERRVDCAAYQAAVLTSEAVPRELLKDWQAALACLVGVIADLNINISNVMHADARKQPLLRASRAVRVILDENGDLAIKAFRLVDNLDAISVLTFGARGRDYDLRLNAVLILGNIIDNTTVCVPLDHLYDPEISSNGRANLLAVVSVVAPWAYKQNLVNMQQVLRYTKGAISGESADTIRVVQELERKIAVREMQLRSERSDEPLPSWASCKSYQKRWAKGRIQ